MPYRGSTAPLLGKLPLKESESPRPARKLFGYRSD